MKKINIVLLTFLVSIFILNISIIKKETNKIESITYYDDNLSDITIDKIYLDNKELNSLPEKGSNVVFDKGECSNNASVSWNDNEWSLVFDEIDKATTCSIYFKTKEGTQTPENPNDIINPSDNNDTNNSNSNDSNNPATGAFFSIFTAIIVIGISVYFIRYGINKRKFHRV